MPSNPTAPNSLALIAPFAGVGLDNLLAGLPRPGEELSMWAIWELSQVGGYPRSLTRLTPVTPSDMS